jgi:ribosomal protein S18 acetylase RimI-like enzyme
METLNKRAVKEFVYNLKHIMYAGIIQQLTLEYIEDEPDSKPYLYLVVIKIKPKYRNQGYGKKVMRSIVRYADMKKQLYCTYQIYLVLI